MRDLIRIINEAQAPVFYHGTSVPAALQILAQDKLKAKAASRIEGSAVSFTTNLETAAGFAGRRDGEALNRVQWAADGMSRSQINRMLDMYGVDRPEAKGVVLALDGNLLDEEGDFLKPYSHYGMEEDEYRAEEWDIHNVGSMLVAIYVNPTELQAWAARVPKYAKAIKNLLNHPKVRQI